MSVISVINVVSAWLAPQHGTGISDVSYSNKTDR